MIPTKVTFVERGGQDERDSEMEMPLCNQGVLLKNDSHGVLEIVDVATGRPIAFRGIDRAWYAYDSADMRAWPEVFIQPVDAPPHPRIPEDAVWR